MPLCNVNIPASASILPVDTRTLPKVLHLPLANQNPGRFLFVKDYYGSSALNPITISTMGGNVFDSNATRLTLQSNYGSLKLLSDGQTKWRSMGFFNGSVLPLVSTGFNPIDANPNYILWLDAADQTSLVFSGDTITQWIDKTGNGYNATGYGNPSLTTINEISSILLEYPNNFSGSIVPQENLTVFAVGLNNGSAGIGSWRLLSLATYNTTDDNTTNGFVVPFESLSNTNTAIGAERNTGTVYTTGVGTIPTNTPFLASGVWTDTAVELYLNGSNLVASNYPRKASGFTFQNYAVGRAIQPGHDGNDPTFVWPGSVGEILVSGVTLSAPQRQQVEGYLAWKWNLQCNLPYNHLYKEYPPTNNLSPIPQSIVLNGLQQNLDAAYYTLQSGSNWLAFNGTFDVLYNRPRIGTAPGGQTTLILNGVNQYAMNQGGTNATSTFSWDVWFKPTVASGTIISEMGQPGFPNSGYSAACLQVVSSYAYVGFYGGSLNLGQVTLNTWNQASWSYSGGILNGYLNGNYVSSEYLTKIRPSLSYYAIGAGQTSHTFGTSNPFKGEIGAAKFYTRELSRGDVSQNFLAFATSRYGQSNVRPPYLLNWMSNIGGNGTVTSNGGGQWSLLGPYGYSNNNWSYIYAQFAYAGSFTYDYNYTTTNIIGYDWIFDSVSSSNASNINNVNYSNIITYTGSGSRTLSYTAGDWVAIGIYSYNTELGRGSLTLNNVPLSNPPGPPPPPFVDPLSLSNCSIWFDATNSASIALQYDSTSNVESWNNLGEAGGIMYPYTGTMVTNTDTINDLNSVRFPIANTMYWDGALPNQEKTIFVLFKSLNDIAASLAPYMNFFSGNIEGTIQTAVFYSGGISDYALCKAGVWCITGSTTLNPSYFTSSLLVTYRLSTNPASNTIRLNGSEVPLYGSNTAQGFYEGYTRYQVSRTDQATSYDLGELVLYSRGLSDTEVSLVETYIINKWSPGGYSPPYSGPYFPGIWFDASDPASISYDPTNCNVLSWSNKGTLGMTADSNPYFNPPLTQQTTQNGLNVLSYTYFNNLVIPSMSLPGGNKSIFIVYSQDTTFTGNNQGQYFFNKDYGSFGEFALISIYAGLADNIIFGTVNSGYCFPVYGISSQVISEFQMLSIIPVNLPTPGTQGTWRDGYFINGDFGCPADNTNAPGSYNVGGSPNGAFFPNPFQFAEMRIYLSSFGIGGRQLVEGEMAWKWGIETTLPPNHPYRYAPPPA